MASCSSVKAESIQRVKSLVERKLKSLTKQKTKLEQYKADQDACKGLSSDQAAAVVHYDCVVRCMEIANDLSKQFIEILQDNTKEIEKIKKQEQQKYIQNEKEKYINKVKEILKIQSVLQQLGSEQVRRDFLAGAKGAILLYHQQLGQIHNLFRMVTPSTKERLSDDQKQNEHLLSATSHLLSLVNEHDTEVAGTTYKQLYSLIQKIYNCPYRKKVSEFTNNISPSKVDIPGESSSSTIENTVDNLPKIKQTSTIANSTETNLNKKKSTESNSSTLSSIDFISNNNDALQRGKEELCSEDEQYSVNQLRQQLMDTEERLRDMERTHGTMSAKLSALTQAQVNSTEKQQQQQQQQQQQHYYGDLSAQCQKCNEKFKALEEKTAEEAQLRLHLSEIDAAREKAVTDLALIVNQRDSLTVTINTQAQDIAQTQGQLQETLNKKIALESRLATLETELNSVRQELSNQTSKKETLDVFHRILIVGDERIPHLAFSKQDTLQIYSKPGLKLDNVLSFIKECNICPVTGVDTLVIVSVGINDIVEMAPVENCRTMNHDPIMVCPNYNALVASAKIITDKIYSVYTDLKDFIRGVVHFTPVLPVDLVLYQGQLLKEHKEKTGHSVIVYNSLANRNLVNTKVNDIISEVNTHVQLFIGEGSHDLEIFKNTEGIQSSQFLSNGFIPSDDTLNSMVNKLKTIQKKHTYNEKMDSNICKLVMNSIERKACRKESLKDWGLKEEENSFTSNKSKRSSNYSRNKNYSMRHHSHQQRNDEEWHSPGRCVSPPDWHHPEDCRKKEFRRTGIHPQSSRDGRKFVDHSESPNRLKESGRSPIPRSRERSRSPSGSRSRSRSRDRTNQRKWSRSPDRRRRRQSESPNRLKEPGRSPNPRSRERSRSPSGSRSRSRSRDRGNQRKWSRSPDRRRKRKSRSVSSRRSNSPRSSRSRSKTPEDSHDIDPSKLKAFNYVIDSLDQDYKVYMANPSSHPEYNNEYAKFYESKSRTISNIGGDVSKYDFSVDWQALWPRRMKDLYKEAKYNVEKQFLSGLSTKDKKYFKKCIRDYNSPSCSDETPRKKLCENIPYAAHGWPTIPINVHDKLNKLPFELVNENKNVQEDKDGSNESSTNEELSLQEVGDEVDDTTIPLLLNDEYSQNNVDEDKDEQPLYPMIPLQIGKFKHCSLSSDNEKARTPAFQLLPPPPRPPVLLMPTAGQIYSDLKSKSISEQVEMFTNFSSLDNTKKEALKMLLKDIESHDTGLALAITAIMK